MEDISRELMVKASRGDAEAFRQIYAKTSAFVYNVALRVTGNATDADEVTQDVFMKAYRNLYKFNFLSSFGTWLYRIAVNAAISHGKAEEKHRKQRADYDSVINTASTGETARGNVDREYSKTRVSAMLATLSADQRACVVLREIEGMPYKEIARALKININTVRTRLKRARQKLMAFAKKGCER